jgi:hypothetical protein
LPTISIAAYRHAGPKIMDFSSPSTAREFALGLRTPRIDLGNFEFKDFKEHEAAYDMVEAVDGAQNAA